MHPDDFTSGTYRFVIEYIGGKCRIGTKEMVHLKKGVLVFKGLDVGSILFVYQISGIVKDYLLQYSFTRQNCIFLLENKIASLTVDGVVIMSSL